MLRLLQLRLAMAQSCSQLVHDVTEYDGVDVLTQHVEEKPISHLGPPDDGINGLSPDQPKPQPQQVHPHTGTHDDYYPGKL